MRVINIVGEINEELAKEVLTEIFRIEEEDNEILDYNHRLVHSNDHKELEDLVVNITSVGGIVHDTLAIYDALSNLKCKIITRGFGICSSGGLYLLLAGDVRLAGKNTQFLYHTLEYGKDLSKLQSHADNMNHYIKVQDKLNDIVVSKTSITESTILDHTNHDWWMLYDEALELGFIHGEV